MKMKEEDTVANYHCLHPEFLQAQLERSLSNIGLEALDLYYLNNASESQMLFAGREKFLERLYKAFEFCEKKVEEGKIKSYGLATWACFRSKANQEQVYLNLEEVEEAARKVGGKEYNFRYVQIPFNFTMSECYFEDWQTLKQGNEVQDCSLFEAAERLKINIMTSVPFAQGLMIQYPISTEIFKAENPGIEHLQYVRSVPSPALITTLVGQKARHHVTTNLEVLKYPVLTKEKWLENVELMREIYA